MDKGRGSENNSSFQTQKNYGDRCIQICSNTEMKILGLCGSLRENSSNSLLLKAAQLQLTKCQWMVFDLAKLPYFDPDNQYSDQTPKIVLELRALASSADLIFVCTPEYAHGIPGVLKNAFEWLFHEGTEKKPVYVVIGSAEGENTKAQLIEILSTMDFSISEEQILLVKGARSLVNADGTLKSEAAQSAFANFCKTASAI
jgi:chromate reductase, NAD(P)H dehydrogenase (quinone)